MSSTDLPALVARLEQVEGVVEELKKEKQDSKKEKQDLKECMKKIQKENQDLKKEVKHYKKSEDLKMKSLFSARLNMPVDELTRTFNSVETCETVYKASPAFDATNCRYTAPEEGHYSLTLGMRQSDNRGSLEVMMIKTRGTTTNHLFVGKTTGSGTTCSKNIIVELKKDDVVNAQVKRHWKWAKVAWISFSGYLLFPTADNRKYEVPSAPPE